MTQYQTNLIALPLDDSIVQVKRIFSGLESVDLAYLYDFLSQIINALDIYPEIDQRKRLYLEQIENRYDISPEDKNRLKTSWLLLFNAIKNIYSALNFWDDMGISWLCYHSLIGGDIMLMQSKPVVTLGNTDLEYRMVKQSRLGHVYSY